jgi:chromosomal replication initiation ATPase DnaA
MAESVRVGPPSDEFAALYREAQAIDRRLAALRPAQEARYNDKLDKIMTATVRYYGVSKRALLAQQRAVFVTRARHVAMLIARRITGHSQREVAQFFHSNRASVAYAQRAATRRMARDPCFRAEVFAVESGLDFDARKEAAPPLGKAASPVLHHFTHDV